MTVRTWRCHICGDGYIGEGKPTHCPFCGAPAKYMMEAEKYKDPVIKEMSMNSGNNINEAIKLEVGNAQFYFSASKNSKDIELQPRFKALAKVESEHATLLSKAINAQPPVIDRNAGTAKKADADNVKEAFDREANAIKHYKQFFEEAKEPRVKEIFGALVEIETTHLELEENTKVK